MCVRVRQNGCYFQGIHNIRFENLHLDRNVAGVFKSNRIGNAVVLNKTGDDKTSSQNLTI